MRPVEPTWSFCFGSAKISFVKVNSSNKIFLTEKQMLKFRAVSGPLEFSEDRKLSKKRTQVLCIGQACSPLSTLSHNVTTLFLIISSEGRFKSEKFFVKNLFTQNSDQRAPITSINYGL